MTRTRRKVFPPRVISACANESIGFNNVVLEQREQPQRPVRQQRTATGSFNRYSFDGENQKRGRAGAAAERGDGTGQGNSIASADSITERTAIASVIYL